MKLSSFCLLSSNSQVYGFEIIPWTLAFRWRGRVITDMQCNPLDYSLQRGMRLIIKSSNSHSISRKLKHQSLDLFFASVLQCSDFVDLNVCLCETPSQFGGPFIHNNIAVYRLPINRTRGLLQVVPCLGLWIPKNHPPETWSSKCAQTEKHALRNLSNNRRKIFNGHDSLMEPNFQLNSTPHVQRYLGALQLISTPLSNFKSIGPANTHTHSWPT